MPLRIYSSCTISLSLSFSLSLSLSLSLYIYIYIHIYTTPRNRKLRTQKLKSQLVRTQSLNVLPLKPGVGQNVAIHATLTARDFFRVYINPTVILRG